MKSIADQAKRKTHTSSEVKRRYNKKTYKRFEFNLRMDDDADLIAYFEKNKQNGISITETIRKLYEASK